MNEILHIAYASDKNYLPYLSVACGSALIRASNVRRIVIDVLALDISESDWSAWYNSTMPCLPKDSVICVHHVDSNRFQSMREWHGSLAAYARLLLPEILPDVDWCVYADIDTLFVEDPLALLEYKDDQFAIRGRVECDIKNLAEKESWFKTRGYPFNHRKYFCSGFVLMNLTWFRRNEGTSKTMEFLRLNPDAPLADQEALNAVCCDVSSPLPNRWGTSGNVAFQRDRPGAIHYPGHNPWCFLDNMFPDYIDAYNIWFLTAKFVYGKTWRDYVKRPRYCKYWAMRFMGWGFTLIRWMVDAIDVKIPYVGRYVEKHYASKMVWKQLIAGLAR